MNLRVRILYFSDGVSCLGGRMSVSAEVTPGVPMAKSIKRLAGGYLVGWGDKLFFVPDSRVEAALVEEIEDEPGATPESAQAIQSRSKTRGAA